MKRVLLLHLLLQKAETLVPCLTFLSPGRRFTRRNARLEKRWLRKKRPREEEEEEEEEEVSRSLSPHLLRQESKKIVLC